MPSLRPTATTLAHLTALVEITMELSRSGWDDLAQRIANPTFELAGALGTTGEYVFATDDQRRDFDRRERAFHKQQTAKRRQHKERN